MRCPNWRPSWWLIWTHTRAGKFIACLNFCPRPGRDLTTSTMLTLKRQLSCSTLPARQANPKVRCMCTAAWLKCSRQLARLWLSSQVTYIGARQIQPGLPDWYTASSCPSACPSASCSSAGAITLKSGCRSWMTRGLIPGIPPRPRCACSCKRVSLLLASMRLQRSSTSTVWASR